MYGVIDLKQTVILLIPFKISRYLPQSSSPGVRNGKAFAIGHFHFLKMCVIGATSSSTTHTRLKRDQSSKKSTIRPGQGFPL